MKKLLNGIVDFRKNVRPTVKDTFALLALGQRPDTLFIACSDSRVVPNLFASTEPGDLFVREVDGAGIQRWYQSLTAAKALFRGHGCSAL